MHKHYPSLCLALAGFSIFFLVGVLGLHEATPIFRTDPLPQTIYLRTPDGQIAFRQIAYLPTSFWLARVYYAAVPPGAYAMKGTMTLSARDTRAFVRILPETHTLAVLWIRSGDSPYSCPIDAPFGADAVTRDRCLKHGNPATTIAPDAADAVPTFLNFLAPTSSQDKLALFSASLHALTERFLIARYFSQSMR